MATDYLLRSHRTLSYRPECITALLVAAAQEHVNDTRRQFDLIYALMALHSGHLHLKVRRLHKRLDA